MDVVLRPITAANWQECIALRIARSEPHRLGHTSEGRPQPLQIFFKAPDGAVYGGIIGSTVWDWLSIDYLWVDERLRSQDYGTELMRRAEIEAKRRGCTRAMVDTFSFQVPGFYEKLGYHVIGTMADYPPGFGEYWLRKELK